MKQFFFPFMVFSSMILLTVIYIQPGNRRSGEKQDEVETPNDWMTYQRAYPSGAINSQAVIEGMMEARTLKMNSPRMRSGWELMGPTNIGGRVTDIEVPLDDESVFYLAAATGGILKSTDAGATWENIFDDQPILTIGDIAIDPTNSNIIYAGTGEANSSTFSFLGNGMYKSTDAGATWTHIGLDNSSFIGRVVVDYSNHERVFAAACGNLFTPDANRGVYRSDDGGLTWQKKLFVTDTTSAIDLVIHPTNPNILYASMWERRRGLNYRRSFGYSSGIYKSADGGDTWQKLTNGLPSYEMGRIGLAIAPTNPDVLYAFCDDKYSIDVFKSTDGGATWVQTNDGSLQGMNSDFGWYFGQVRVDPTDENRAYVMGVELWRTDDGGNSWIKLAGYDIGDIHVDHHAMTISPTTGRILEGNDGGLFKSNDLGVNWSKFYYLPITQFYEVEFDFQNPFRLYGGTQDNNTIKTYGGNINQWYPILGGDGFYCLVDYRDPEVVYAEYQYGGLNRSINGGGNFFSIMTPEMQNDRKNWSMPIVMDPEESTVLFAGTFRVWRSDLSGSDWYPISEDLTKGPDGSGWHTISTLAVSPVDRNIVLAGTDDGRVHVATDGGFTWTNITAGLPDRYVTRVAADPTDANTIYVTLSGFRWDEPIPYVFRSTDLGATWQDISGNLPQLPVNAIAIDPENGTIIVGTDAGVFFTQDAGANWYALAEGIPNVPVVTLKIHEPTRSLLAGTYGRSAYKISLDDVHVGMKESEAVQMNLDVSPSLFMTNSTTRMKISYSTPGNGTVELSILDLKGNVVRRLRSSRESAGKHEASWNGTLEGGRVPTNGIYFCRLTTPAGTLQKKVMLINGN